MKLSSESIANAGGLLLGLVGAALLALGKWLMDDDDHLAQFPDIDDPIGDTA